MRRRRYDEAEESRPRRKVVDALAVQINQASVDSNQVFQAISHEMKKAMMALKRGDFTASIQAAGQAASTSQNLPRILLQFEDLINRMKLREEFKAEQIRLIEAGEYPIPNQTKVV